MSETKLWNHLTRTDVVVSLWTAAGLGGAMSSAAVWLASRVAWIADQGWAAVVLAGIVVASLLGIMLAAIAAAIAAWRWRKGSAASQPQAPAIAAPPDTEHRLAALERQLGETVAFLGHARKVVDENTAAVSKFRSGLGAAIAEAKAEADRAASARLDAVGKTWDHAHEQLRKRLDALASELRREIAALDERGQDKLEKSGDFLQERIVNLESRLDGLQQQVFDMLRARDTADELRALDARASDLFRCLARPDAGAYENAASWLADYGRWRSLIVRYWDAVRAHSDSVEHPFALNDADFDGAEDAPDTELFASNETRMRYQTMLIVAGRHARLRDNAHEFLQEKGSPPPSPVAVL